MTLPSAVDRRPAAGTGLDILFEDDYLLAVSKPAGIVAHPCYKHPDGTVYDALLRYLGRAADADAGSAGRAGSDVHPRLLQRLDKGTSGVMLVSKTLRAHAGVIRAMGRGVAGGVRKEYLAIVHGVPEPGAGEIALRLRRDPADSRRVAASATEGKESVTRYAVIASSLAERRDVAGSRTPETERPLASLVRCEPISGRMHQIRVHLAARGWPIAGDPVYGPGELAGAPALGRQALHAWRVTLTHPITAAPLVVTAPIPPDIIALLDGLSIDAADWIPWRTAAGPRGIGVGAAPSPSGPIPLIRPSS